MCFFVISISFSEQQHVSCTTILLNGFKEILIKCSYYGKSKNLNIPPILYSLIPAKNSSFFYGVSSIVPENILGKKSHDFNIYSSY